MHLFLLKQLNQMGYGTDLLFCKSAHIHYSFMLNA